MRTGPRPGKPAGPSPAGAGSGDPSNDLLADRRFAWARGLAEAGDHAAAADLVDQAMALVPGWAPGWVALAEARERAGDGGGARAAWARADALDPGEALGAGLHLARLDGRTPDAMPDGYLRRLFDDYAPRFERHLTETLGYDGPALLVAALDRVAPARAFGGALDLGCGTGLMGLALRGRAAAIDGVDLSPAMVDRARATGAYARLDVGPLAAALAAAAPGAYDLVTAADVMVYVGDLAPVLAGIGRALAPGGLALFTVQSPDREDAAPRGFALGPDLRFVHAPSHVRGAVEGAGLVVRAIDPASIRSEKGSPVPGLVAVAERARPASSGNITSGRDTRIP